ncbi:unnamed protein product [[Candida] boidinii]|nr:unnamed protein product [[Candida] boidinii]
MSSSSLLPHQLQNQAHHEAPHTQQQHQNHQLSANSHDNTQIHSQYKNSIPAQDQIMNPLHSPFKDNNKIRNISGNGGINTNYTTSSSSPMTKPNIIPNGISPSPLLPPSHPVLSNSEITTKNNMIKKNEALLIENESLKLEIEKLKLLLISKDQKINKLETLLDKEFLLKNDDHLSDEELLIASSNDNNSNINENSDYESEHDLEHDDHHDHHQIGHRRFGSQASNIDSILDKIAENGNDATHDDDDDDDDNENNSVLNPLDTPLKQQLDIDKSRVSSPTTNYKMSFNNNNNNNNNYSNNGNTNVLNHKRTGSDISTQNQNLPSSTLSSAAAHRPQYTQILHQV